MKTKKYLSNSVVRTVLLLLIQVVILVVNSTTGGWSIDKETSNELIARKLWFFVFEAIYIIVSGCYAYNDTKQSKNRENNPKGKELQKEVEAYNVELRHIATMVEMSQDRIRKANLNMLRDNIIALRDWNYEVVANDLCFAIHNTICKIAERGNEFSINIYIKELNEYNQECITMIAHEGLKTDPPHIYGNTIKVSELNNYCYAKLIAKDNPEIVIYPNWTEIERHFYFKDKNSKLKHKDDYRQYIGIPICGKGEPVNSLIEIIAHKSSYIAKKKKKIDDIINRYIIIFKGFALLALAIERNMKQSSVIGKDKEVK